jgi:hypothetical protein
LLECSEPIEEEYDALKKLVDNRVPLHDVVDVFIKAVEDIKAESGVGLSMEGDISGKLCGLFYSPLCFSV